MNAPTYQPSHHPTPDLLASYSAGALEPGFALVVGAHVERCSICRAKVAGYEAVSGEALADLPGADLAPEALQRVMARLDSAPRRDARAPLRPLLEALPLKPRKWVAPGVWVAGVDTPHAPDDRVYVLSVAPGGLTARHAHEGREFCTVLKGAYRDALGRFAAGDFAAAEGAFAHQPRVEGEEACVCLFATEGRLRPGGFLARLAFAYADV